MKRRNLIDIIERFQTQHSLQEEREMQLRHNPGHEDKILSGSNPTKPLVANLSGSRGEGTELESRPQLTDAKKQQ
jgi:hypothetical protein